MDYTQYDYNALVETISQKLGTAEGWGEAYQSSTGQLLIQLFADTTDSLMYLLEKRSQESFLSTARLQSSIYAHASELGYRPRRAVSMTGTVTIQLENSAGVAKNAVADVVIPKNTKISSINPAIDFVTTEEVIVPAGSSTAEIPVKEGVFVQEVVDTTTEPFLSERDYTIEDYRYIDEYSLYVYDDSDEYYDVDSNDPSNDTFGALAYASPTSTAYDIKFSFDGMRIVFGDDIFGKTPEGTLYIEYVKSQQEKLPFLSTGVEFEFETDALFDVSGSIPLEVYYYTITNTTQITGYTEPESVVDIAKNAPIYTNTNKRAVILADYEYWSRRSGIGGIVDVKAYGEEESNSLIFNMNNVNISYVTSNNTELNQQQQIDFRNYMDRYKTATTHIVLEQAETIELVLDITLKKDTRVPITNEEFYQEVKTAVEDFMDIEKGSIGKEFQHSELVEHLQNLTYTGSNGVVYPMTDFVNVLVTPQYALPNPILTYDAIVDLSETYTIQTNDTWTIEFDIYENQVLQNTITCSVFVQSGETYQSLVTKMANAITTQTGFSTEISIVNTFHRLRIVDTSNSKTFDIDITQGDIVSPHVTSNVVTNIPSSTIYNEDELDLMIPGTGQIVDENENVEFQDDGNGFLVPTSGTNIAIDYKGVSLYDVYYPNPAGQYYFRFQQNAYDNVKINTRGVVVLSPFAASLSDPEEYSSITLI